MSKNIFKSILLTMLIVTCITQTAMLWLGNVSSHNFLEKETAINRAFSPEAIWVNTVSFAYRINDQKREYEILISELNKWLVAEKNNLKLQPIKDYSWEKILGEPGIIYEYSMPISLEELVGTKVNSNNNVAIKQAILTVPTESTSKIRMYLIEEDGEKAYKVEFFGDSENLLKIQEVFTKEEVTRSMPSYQASVFSNIKKYIKGNVFLSLNSTDTPLEYKAIQAYNPIELEGENKMNALEAGVNSLFANPLTKEIEEKENGTITFTEYQKGVVTYKPEGVLEYVNFTNNNNNSPMSRLEGYDLAKQFIQKSRAIDANLKDDLYLSNIKQNGDEYTYYFDRRFKGYKINLGQEIKEYLKMDAQIELTVKNHQLTKGKWLVLELSPIYDEGRDSPKTVFLTQGYVEPINSLIEQGVIGTGRYPLENMECVYVLEKLDTPMEMKWAATYEGEWYYP